MEPDNFLELSLILFLTIFFLPCFFTVPFLPPLLLLLATAEDPLTMDRLVTFLAAAAAAPPRASESNASTGSLAGGASIVEVSDEPLDTGVNALAEVGRDQGRENLRPCGEAEAVAKEAVVVVHINIVVVVMVHVTRRVAASAAWRVGRAIFFSRIGMVWIREADVRCVWKDVCCAAVGGGGVVVRRVRATREREKRFSVWVGLWSWEWVSTISSLKGLLY
jgi:hypothetical protein